MKANRVFYYLATFVALVLTMSGNAGIASSKAGTFFGETKKLGKGTVRPYAELNPDGSPKAIGVTFTKKMLEGLPTSPNDQHHCFDVNKDGSINPPKECVGGHERILPLPKELAKRSDTPFRWVLLNWNTFGHIPKGVYTVPHFDFHFYTMSLEERNAIRPGSCGLAINCDDFKRATIPVPAQYMPQGYKNVNAAEGAMGNHLVDLTSLEFGNPPMFTRTFIYGTYDGHIIFYEPMITQAHFMSQPSECMPLKLPKAWEVSGYYPTTYCIRYLENRREYTVSIESFIYRKAK